MVTMKNSGEFATPLKAGFDKFTDRHLVLGTESGQQVDMELTGVQLVGIFTALGIEITETGWTGYSDEEIVHSMPELVPTWVDVSEAARRLHITVARVYQLAHGGSLETRDDAGKLLISVESINKRIESDPKPGRPYDKD